MEILCNYDSAHRIHISTKISRPLTELSQKSADLNSVDIPNAVEETTKAINHGKTIRNMADRETSRYPAVSILIAGDLTTTVLGGQSLTYGMFAILRCRITRNTIYRFDAKSSQLVRPSLSKSSI